jgi:hypothetical protein
MGPFFVTITIQHPHERLKPIGPADLFLFYFVVLGFELRVFTLSHSTFL